MIVWRRQNRHKRPSRAAASGARPAIVVETATSPRRRSTGARSPAITARAVVMRNGAVPTISRRTRRRPRKNRRRGRPRDLRNRPQRTPRPSTVEWSCPTASRAAAARGTWRRAARPAPSLLMEDSVLTKTASTASGRTAAGTARTRALATSSNGTTRVLRRPSLRQNRRRSPRRV